MVLDSREEFTARDWELDVEGTVRFAIVGLGWFGKDEAIPITDRSAYCETTVVVSGDREKAERVGDEHDATPLTYDEFRDGQATGEYDAIYVATPNALHLPYAETAAEHGKDVLCEKPLEGTAERGRELVETCEEAGVTLMVAYRMHLEPVTRRVRELVREGFVGDVVQVDGAFCGSNLHRGDPDQWRFDPDLAGGGALFDIGIYPLNTARFLLDADPVAVEATVTPNEEILDGMDVHASFQLDFPGDAVASCRTSYDSALDSYYTVLGTDGRIEVRDAFHGEEQTLVATDGDVETEVVVETDELFEEFEYFAQRVLADDPVEPDGRHGQVDMEIMEAVYEADERGERVER